HYQEDLFCFGKFVFPPKERTHLRNNAHASRQPLLNQASRNPVRLFSRRRGDEPQYCLPAACGDVPLLRLKPIARVHITSLALSLSVDSPKKPSLVWHH